MSYGIEFDESVMNEFYSWGMPLEAYEEVERRLEVELSERPTQFLRDIGGALQYVCRVVERGANPVVHICLFYVRYSRDEQTLIIWDCYHFPLRP